VKIRNRMPIEFTSVDKVDYPERYLDKCVELLEGYSWCFGFGTALGLYREKGFIPRDTDIDICVFDGDAEELKKIFGNEWFLIREVSVDGVVHQLAFQDNNLFIIDLCFFYREGDDYVSCCEGGHWRDPVRVVGVPRLVPTRFGSYPVPEMIEEYLVSRYGDWQTPKYGMQCCSRKEAL